jgi:magnesium chelatase family protein
MLLIAAMKSCLYARAAFSKDQKRIFSPILDRNDIHIEVPRVDYKRLSGDRIGETSECIRSRVQAARDIQMKRYYSTSTMPNIRNSNNEVSSIVCNADMGVGEIRQFCKMGDEG